MFDRILMLALLALAPLCIVLAEDLPLRDPTQPHQEQPAAERGSTVRRLMLSAVLVSPQRRVAVINGKLFHEGDLVDGSMITQIESKAVHLTRGGEERIVRLDTETAGIDKSQGVSAQ